MGAFYSIFVKNKFYAQNVLYAKPYTVSCMLGAIMGHIMATRPASLPESSVIHSHTVPVTRQCVNNIHFRFRRAWRECDRVGVRSFFWKYKEFYKYDGRDRSSKMWIYSTGCAGLITMYVWWKRIWRAIFYFTEFCSSSLGHAIQVVSLLSDIMCV